MNTLRGHKKRYFSLSAIVIYAVMHRVGATESSCAHYLEPHSYNENKTSPPIRDI